MGSLGKRWTVESRSSTAHDCVGVENGCTNGRHFTNNSGQFKSGVARPDVSENMKRRHEQGSAHQLTAEERAQSSRTLGVSQINPNSLAQGAENIRLCNERARAIGPKDYKGKFTYTLRKQVRDRDGQRCVLCDKPNGLWILLVHHLDYDRSHNTPDNLVTLCRSCHTGGHRRGYWPIGLRAMTQHDFYRRDYAREVR